MPITQSVLDGYDLPVQFTYRYRQPKRTSYMPTVEGGVIRAGADVVVKDTLVVFEIRDEDDYAVITTLRTKHEASDNPDYTFVGHLDTSNDNWTVKFEDFDPWPQDGLWHARGILRIVS